MFFISFLIFALSLIYKAVHINDANIAYYSTFSVAIDLASGCMMATIYMYFEKEIKNVRLFSTNTYLGIVKYIKKERKKRQGISTTFKEDGVMALAFVALRSNILYYSYFYTFKSIRIVWLSV